MILPQASTRSRTGVPHRCQRAFTLTEFLVTASIFFLVIGGVIYAHLFGLQMMRLTEDAADTSEADRRFLRTLTEEIATAKNWDLGFGSAASFSRLAGFRLQQANGLQIYPTTNTTPFIRYYLDSSQKLLYRITNGATKPEIAVRPVLNTTNLVFSTEDGQGRVLSNRTQTAVLRVELLLRDEAPQTWGVRPGRDTHWLRAKFKLRADD